MTLKKALAIVLSGSTVFALLGGGLGAVLGVMAPGYYRTVFGRRGNVPDFDPFQVGIGLGLTQGLGAGIVLSLAVVTLLAWRDFRTATANTGELLTPARRGPRSGAWWVLWGVVTVITAVVFCGIGFVCGIFVGQEQLYYSWTERKLATVGTILKSNEFPNVQPGFSSAAQVYLSGTVPSEELRTTLHDRLVQAFGTEEADKMIFAVKVSR